jgi:hypothetical protein
MLGIGPEISESIKAIYAAANVCVRTSPAACPDRTFIVQVPIQWEEVSVTPVLKGGKTVIPDVAIQSVKKNTVALKGTRNVLMITGDWNLIFEACDRSACDTKLVTSLFCSYRILNSLSLQSAKAMCL